LERPYNMLCHVGTSCPCILLILSCSWITIKLKMQCAPWQLAERTTSSLVLMKQHKEQQCYIPLWVPARKMVLILLNGLGIFLSEYRNIMRINWMNYSRKTELIIPNHLIRVLSRWLTFNVKELLPNTISTCVLEIK